MAYRHPKDRLKYLRNWRTLARPIAEALQALYPGARLYLIGSVARGTLTLWSDIDFLVVLPRGAAPRKFGVATRILVEAMDRGLPFEAPVELHVVFEGEEKDYLREPHVEVNLSRR